MNLYLEHIARKLRGWRKAVGREEAHDMFRTTFKKMAKEKRRRWRFSVAGYKERLESRAQKYKYNKIIRQELPKKALSSIEQYRENYQLFRLIMAQLACLIEERNIGKEAKL